MQPTKSSLLRQILHGALLTAGEGSAVSIYVCLCMDMYVITPSNSSHSPFGGWRRICICICVHMYMYMHVYDYFIGLFLRPCDMHVRAYSCVYACMTQDRNQICRAKAHTQIHTQTIQTYVPSNERIDSILTFS